MKMINHPTHIQNTNHSVVLIVTQGWEAGREGSECSGLVKACCH